MNKQIHRKYDFTKRWPFKNIEDSEDTVLVGYINLIDKDNNKIDKIPSKYQNFLNEYKKISNQESAFYNNIFHKFIEKNLVRKSKIIKIKEFIFFDREYEEHDIYFPTKDLENKFFEMSKKILDYFLNLYRLYVKFNVENNIDNFKYFYPKDSVSENTEIMNHFPLWDGRLSDDIRKFTELTRQKWMSHHSFDPKPCTDRTVNFLTKLHNLAVQNKVYDDKDKYLAKIPNMPTLSYVQWYFRKIKDENNRVRRNIELVLRSRKRSKDLSESLNYIYIMSNEGFPKDTYKIGWTSELPEDRAEALTSTGVLYDFKVEYSAKFKDAEKIEKKIHKYFDKYRVKRNKEMFTVKKQNIINYIESLKS